MNFKKISCLILAVMILSAVCGCGKKGIVILPAAYDSQTQYEFPGTGEVASAGGFSLSFDEKFGFPIFSGESFQKRWDSSLGGNMSASTLFVKLYDPTYEAFTTVKSVDAVGEGRVKFEPVTDGARVTYYFDEFEVAVPVYYTVNESGLTIKIDPSEIDEHNYTVMAVSVTPYLCSARNEKNNNRYLVIPSGSGALMYTDCRGSERTYEEEVYGDDLAREKKWAYTNSQQVYLPVFGAVDGNEAMYGIITSGAECSSIGANAGENALGFSGVYPIYNVRAYNSVQIDIGGTTGLKGFLRLAKERNSEIFEVQYRLLAGENASYNGIAAAYREYLGLKGGTKNKYLNLTFLGGLMANRSALGIPYSTFSSTTTVSQAKEIVSEVFDANKTAMNIRLLGYGQSGLNVTKLAGGFKINSDLASESDVRDFQSLCKKSGSDLFVDYDVIQLVNSGNGYSKKNDVAVDTTDYRIKKYTIDISHRNVDTTQRGKYLLKRSKISSAVDDVLKSAGNYGIAGVSLETLGISAYSDFSERRYFGKGKTADDVSSALLKVAKAKTKLLTVSPNDYAAKLSDYIDSIPTVSSNSDALDVDIPFYGIVFSGCKETSVAVNLSSQPKKAFLDAIKTGSGLSFVLAADVNSDAVGSVFSAYICSDYESNKKVISNYYSQARKYFDSVSGVCIKSYEILGKGISKTVFENGVTVIVNQTADDMVYEGLAVKAMSFIVR